MSDDKTNIGEPDRSRIAMGEDHEVAYWTAKFGVTREELQDAVNGVGTSAEKVAVFLGRPI